MSKIKINTFIVNIKLQSSLKGSSRTKEYIRIIKELSRGNNVLPCGKNEGVQMYAVRGGKNVEVPDFLYGHMAKGTYIPDKEIDVVEDGKIVKDTNKPRILNPIVCDFLFIPNKHRLIVEKKYGGPTEKQVLDYLQKFLNKIISHEDILEIILEKDKNVINQIYEAKSVFKLSYEISYTNDDVIGHLGEDLEEIIKDSKIGKLKLSAESDNKKDGLKIDTVMLGGGLELAKSNGTINSAQILRHGSKKPINISNKEKPKNVIIEVDLDLGGKFRLWYKEIIKHLKS